MDKLKVDLTDPTLLAEDIFDVYRHTFHKPSTIILYGGNSLTDRVAEGLRNIFSEKGMSNIEVLAIPGVPGEDQLAEKYRVDLGYLIHCKKVI